MARDEMSTTLDCGVESGGGAGEDGGVGWIFRRRQRCERQGGRSARDCLPEAECGRILQTQTTGQCPCARRDNGSAHPVRLARAAEGS